MFVPGRHAARGLLVADDVLIARIGKPHGLRGEVTVQVHTDRPEERFLTGQSFITEPASAGPLVIRTARDHNGIQLLSFEGHLDRTAAEALRGVRLLGVPDEDEDDAWYADDLVGLSVQDTAGRVVGTVADLLSRPVQDLLEVTLAAGGTAYVPFVEEIVPEVDTERGIVVIDPPEGLLELGEQ